MHRFRDIAIDMFNVDLFGYTTLAFNPRRRGSPGTISVKFCTQVRDGYGTKWRRTIAENFNRLSRVTNVTDDRQTDDDRRIYDGIIIPERNADTFG